MRRAPEVWAPADRKGQHVGHPVGRRGAARPVRRASIWLGLLATVLVIGPALLLYTVHLRDLEGTDPASAGVPPAKFSSARFIAGPPPARTPEPVPPAKVAPALQTALPAGTSPQALPTGLAADGSLVPRKVTTRAVHVPAPRTEPRGQPDLIAGLIAVPILLRPPQPAVRPPSAVVAASELPQSTSLTERPAPAPPPVRLAPAPPPMPETTPPAVPQASPQASDPVAELARQTAQLKDTGRLDPAVVQQRLAVLKADASFDHGATRFPLTGKHKRVDCASCHKTTLKDTPRQCIDCHKKDDVHRGRRPDCQECHVTTNWTTIRRGR